MCEDNILMIWITAAMIICAYLGNLYGQLKGYRDGLRDGGKLMNNFLVREGLLGPKYLELVKDD